MCANGPLNGPKRETNKLPAIPTTILEGARAVEAALECDSREIEEIFVAKDRLTPEVARLEKLAQAKNVRLTWAEKGVMAEMLVTGRTHGGVLAVVGPRRLVDKAHLVDNSAPFVVMLDGVEDPYNLGQAMRALYPAGATGLVIRSRSWLSATAILGRASGGASERLAMAEVDSVAEALDFFKGQGLTIAITAQDHSLSLYQADLTKPLFLLIGGEKRGLSRPLRAKADLLLNIPYGRPFESSLGTAGATAILAFEVMRQRSDQS